jgi:hypothetical protein
VVLMGTRCGRLLGLAYKHSGHRGQIEARQCPIPRPRVGFLFVHTRYLGVLRFSGLGLLTGEGFTQASCHINPIQHLTREHTLLRSKEKTHKQGKARQAFIEPVR